MNPRKKPKARGKKKPPLSPELQVLQDRLLKLGEQESIPVTAEGSGLSWSWLSKARLGLMGNPLLSTVNQINAYLDEKGIPKP